MDKTKLTVKFDPIRMNKRELTVRIGSGRQTRW